MSSHYKAFIVVIVVSTLALFFFRKPFSQALGARQFNNWRNMWLAIVVSAFLITNYWIFLFVSGLIVFVLSRSEPLKPAIYLLMMASAPTFGAHLQGFAGINRLIEVSPQLVFSAILLIPALFAAKHMKKIARAGTRADLLFLLWLILQIALAMRASTFTHMLRTGLEQFLVAAPLYYVFSRYPKSFADIRTLSAALILPILVLSAVTVPEFLRSWHLYNSVTTNWLGQINFGYVLRGGVLRAAASVFNPIVWGFLVMTAIGISLAFFNDRFPRFYRQAGFALLLFGLIASMSRGPWMGAMVTLIAFVLIGRNMAARTAQLVAGGTIAFLIGLATPFGQKLINLLPFIGTSSTDTISYRQQLLDAAWEVMLQSPFFGTGDFLAHPKLQPLRQGQGIIDIVNTYLQVGLKSGFVGLVMFVGIFLCVLQALRKAMKSARRYDLKLALYCQAYLATTIGIMVTIFTVSSVGQIPIVYWSLLGIAIAIARVEEVQSKEFLRVKSLSTDTTQLEPEFK